MGIWNELGDNEESLSFVLNDITPVKACGDLGSHNTDSGRFSTNFIPLKHNKKQKVDDVDAYNFEFYVQLAGDMSSSKKEFTDNTKDREKCELNSSQVKRRRMLQFESEALPVPYCNEQMPSISLEEKVCVIYYIFYVCK